MPKVLILRTNDAENKSYGGFQWPESGPVEAPDWSPEPKCGNGLHGLLWGEGGADHLLHSDDTRRWVVASVDSETIVDLRGKVKFPRAEVVFCGDRDGAVAYMLANGAAGKAVPFAVVTAGYRGTATAGDSGTATAGYSGTATAGDYGTATAGDSGTATAGYSGTATAGYRGTATAGDYGTATAGDSGTATAGYRGTATAGYYGTATAGYYGTATAGDCGTIVVSRWDSATQRKRLEVGYIGENGLLPNTPYRWDNGWKVADAKATK